MTTARLRRQRSAFSLVEVTLALGIVSFGLLSVIGLMSSGLSSLSTASERSIMSRITAGIAHDVLHGDFDELAGGLRYYDSEGVELPVSRVASSIYQAQTVLSPDASNPHSKVVLVQVAHNPGGSVSLAQEGLRGGIQIWSKVNNKVTVATQAIRVGRRTPFVTP